MNETEIKVVKALQEDLPLVERPYAEIAGRIGLTEEELLDIARRMKESGVIRRFGAAVGHRKLGYQANGMSVWQVPEDKVDEVGQVLAAYAQVSHCYTRPSFPGFPYNLYGMMHAHDREAVLALATEISERTGVEEYRILFSSKEFKKSSMRFFTEGDDVVSD